MHAAPAGCRTPRCRTRPGSSDHGRVSPPSARARLLQQLAAAVPPPGGAPAVRVAVDGVDGVGKTVFADGLAAALAAAGRHVVRASIDDFHRPRAERYRRGRDSPVGFWRDSFDLDRLRSDLLDPLSPGGSGRYRRGVFDWRADRPREQPWQQWRDGGVLVLDGLFLHRDELAGYWHHSVLLVAPFTVTVPRLATRDGSHPDPDHPSLRRYIEGQRRYFAACDPAARATVVVDNSDWDRPRVVPAPAAAL